MNKNVKRIVAMTLAIGTVSVAAPATNSNLLTTKAYAASSNDETDLTSLSLLDDSGNEIKLYDSDEYDKRVHNDDVDSDDVYYAKTSSQTVNIDIAGPSKKYVRVFKGVSKTAQGKEVGEDIRLSRDTQTTLLVVKVYGEEPGDNVTYDDDDQYDLLSTYKIKVKYTGDASSSITSGSYSSSSTMTADDYDSIYLDRMSVDGNNINLSESEINYTYNVNDNVDQVVVRAVPEDKDEDTVEIDNTEVDNYENYKKTISLKKGANKIQVDITDEDDNERIYTLTINRGSVSSTTTTDNTNKTTSGVTTGTDAGNAANKWVQVNGKWQYKDATGNAVKNSWMQNYYLQADGNMATGWLSYNGSWYYLGTDGAVKNGWQSVNGIWYFLDSQGKMVTGWIKDTSGKYYYFNSNGSMAYSTTINGYKLGADGAWIGR